MRIKGSKMYTPDQIEEIRREAIRVGKEAVQKELEGKTREKFQAADAMTSQLQQRLQELQNNREQRESALAIIKDATKTLDMIVTQAVMVLQETKE